jgi:beta-glucosidase
VAGYFVGQFPPGKKDMGTAFTVMENLARAHAAAYHKIKELQQEARVGYALDWRGFKPALSWSPIDRLLANTVNRIFNEFFPTAFSEGKLRFLSRKALAPELKGTQDYVGINYYTSENVGFDPFNREELFSARGYPAEAELSPHGMIASQPTELFRAIKWALHFKLPIIITENGTEDHRDDFRRRYLVEHIHQVWRAVNFNFPVKGYFHWSLVDNFEWAEGWVYRFGLWELDLETQARRKRPSADLYAAICQENALSSQMVREYAPELVKKLFPG